MSRGLHRNDKAGDQQFFFMRRTTLRPAKLKYNWVVVRCWLWVSMDRGCWRLEDCVVGSLPTLIYIPNFVSEPEQCELLHHIYEVSSTRWKNLKNRRLQNWGGVVHEKGLLPQELPPWLVRITQRIHEKTSLIPSDINHVLINEYLPDQGIMPHQDGPAYFPVVSILSLEAPAVIDFTPHPRLKACSEQEGLSTEDPSTTGQVSEVQKGVLLNDSVCSLKDNQCSLLLMPCSLLIFKDQAYSDYLHGIQDSTVHSLGKVVNSSQCMELEEWKESHPASKRSAEENCFNRTSTRISLTCRLVPKVRKNLFKF